MNAMVRPQDQGARKRIIENHALYMQRELWNLRHKLWARDVPSDPLGLLEPGVALQLKGFSIESKESLGEFLHNGRRTDVAGLVDFAQKSVSISRRFSKPVQLFTAAHELGHVVLHPHKAGLLRDRPLDGPGQTRDWREREADWFASFFLMPAKQVQSHFVDSFRSEQFELTDATAFELCTSDVETVSKRYRSPRDLSRKLAEARMYGGRSIVPLASRFNVTTTAMAIRLEEMGLVG